MLMSPMDLDNWAVIFEQHVTTLTKGWIRDCVAVSLNLEMMSFTLAQVKTDLG